jgi:putative transposase
MSRQRRSHLPAGGFHITSRGALRQVIYVDHYDYEHFERDLHRISEQFEWVLYAYCLMPNHFHLLVNTDPTRLAAGMQRLKLRHAIRFNTRHVSTGHVFERRYWSGVILDEPHLCDVARYIVLNPVRAGLREHPAFWEWSSYNATAGRHRGLVDYPDLLSEFGGDRTSYAAFVAERIASARLAARRIAA